MAVPAETDPILSGKAHYFLNKKKCHANFGPGFLEPVPLPASRLEGLPATRAAGECLPLNQPSQAAGQSHQALGNFKRFKAACLLVGEEAETSSSRLLLAVWPLPPQQACHMPLLNCFQVCLGGGENRPRLPSLGMGLEQV